LSQIKIKKLILLLFLIVSSMKRPKYPYRIAIIMLLLTAVPIGATQLGWHLYGKQVGFDYGMIAGTFAVILAGYLMYEKGWRNEDEDED
jgi:hypothetical protein